MAMSRTVSMILGFHHFPHVVGCLTKKFPGTSRDETFFEATPWFESDCEDDFYSVNGGNNICSGTALEQM